DPRQPQHAAHARRRRVAGREAARGALDRSLRRGPQRPPRATDRGDRRRDRASLRARTRGLAESSMSDLLFRPLTQQIDALARRSVSAVELLSETLARIAATRETLNAFTAVDDRDALLAQARDADQRIASGRARQLEGIPLGVKDLFDARGLPTTMGSVP